MAVLALFLPVVLLGALLGLARVEEWTTPRRPATPGRDGSPADREERTVDLRDSAAPAEAVAAEVSATAA
ncbi:MAG TPA: hypothetical protein VFS29_12485 [Motilibacteraceae bacterium]|nr:hypothetical protein [Motilibacteraceae bacterium]